MDKLQDIASEDSRNGKKKGELDGLRSTPSQRLCAGDGGGAARDARNEGKALRGADPQNVMGAALPSVSGRGFEAHAIGGEKERSCSPPIACASNPLPETDGRAAPMTFCGSAPLRALPSFRASRAAPPPSPAHNRWDGVLRRPSSSPFFLPFLLSSEAISW